MPEGGEQPLALVLSGGGARGAYEAGVLRYALGKLALRRGRSAVPQIFCGTSVGAINACPLAALVREFIPWRELHQNVADGGVRAVTLSATDVETGHTVIFVESCVDQTLYSTDASVEYVSARLKPQHALASAAIPIIFPTVRVGGRLFVDGSVRQNTPISPAIRMGCERVLVIGLRAHPRTLLARASRRQEAAQQESLSSPLYLFGKLLDALLLDRIENDLANLRWGNATRTRGARSWRPSSEARER